MADISAYSFISFINGLNINVSLNEDTFVPINDRLRSSLNKYWNEGRFIGTGLPAGENYYCAIQFEILDDRNPLIRTEKITLVANVDSPQWSDAVRLPVVDYDNISQELIIPNGGILP